MNKSKTSRQKYLTEDEYKRLLGVIRNERDYVLFFLCGNLGLRVGELVRLRVSDIMKDETGFYLKIPTLKRGGVKGKVKGSIQRGELPKAYEDIPLSSDLASIREILSKYISKYKIKDWIFPYKGLHLPEYTVARYFKSYARKVGMDPRYSIHSLRHFKGFYTYKMKTDLRAVQILLRHRDIKTTAIYADANLDSKRKIVEGLELFR